MFILKRKTKKDDNSSTLISSAIMLGYFGVLRLLYIASAKYLEQK